MKRSASFWARVELLEGESVRWRFDFDSDGGEARVSIGTDVRCEWRIEAAGVSPIHVELYWDGASLFLSDAAGEVLLDGRRLSGWTAVDGVAFVELGSAKLRVERHATEQTVAKVKLDTETRTMGESWARALFRVREGLAAEPSPSFDPDRTILDPGLPDWIVETERVEHTAPEEPPEPPPALEEPPTQLVESFTPLPSETPPAPSGGSLGSARLREILSHVPRRTGALLAACFGVGVLVLSPIGRGTPPKASRPTASHVALPSPAERVNEATADNASPPSEGSPPRRIEQDSAPRSPSEEETVGDAVGLVLSGRLSEARVAYAELARRHPEDPRFATMVRTLDSKLRQRCRAEGECDVSR